MAGVTTVYATRKPALVSEIDVLLKRLIDEEYTRHPFYDSRKIVVYMGRCEHKVNRKRAQRLMRSMGLAAIAPGPNTGWAHPQHKVYLNGYASMGELLLGLSNYFMKYNGDRPHQALGNKTPDEVYQSASGGGAMIVDKYGAKRGLPVALRSSGTEFRKDNLEKTLGIEFKNRGSAEQLHET